MVRDPISGFDWCISKREIPLFFHPRNHKDLYIRENSRGSRYQECKNLFGGNRERKEISTPASYPLRGLK